MITEPLIANLVCGSPTRNHDFDFARRKLLDALYAASNIRSEVFSNYDATSAIEGGDLLVSYTSQVFVSDSASLSIRRFLEGGGRWFAIHASNSVLDNRLLPEMLGSRFIAHPPYMRYTVSVTSPSDPLMLGIASEFEVDDELYVISRSTDDLEVLLHTQWGGSAMGQDFPNATRPLMYRHRVGAGGGPSNL